MLEAALPRAALHLGLSLLLLTNSPWSLPSAPAFATAPLSSSQKIAAEAWRVADKEYVDRDFAGQDWFQTRQKMVQRKYAVSSAPDEVYDEIRKMLASLGDKYTRFLTPAMFDAVYSVATGDVAGIGVELQAVPKSGAPSDSPEAIGAPTAVKLVSVVEGSPAERAGLRPGDAVEEVDGNTVGSLSAEEAAARVRGAVGTKLRIVVRRDGESEPLVRLIERASVKLEGVTSSLEVKDGAKIGLVKIKQFSTTTAADVAAALEALKAKKASALLVDLRGNTGGYFTGGVDVARLFLKKDAVITFVTDKKRNVVTYQAYEDGAYTTEPLIVLVDERTASASEILSSALQDNERATLVGTKTFGKAVIQTVEKLNDGSAVVVTIARYETPKHTNINKQGIQPTITKECPKVTPAIECLPKGLA